MLTLLLFSPPAIAQNEVREEDEVLLFALQLERVDLSDAIPVYQRGPLFLLPLGEVSRLLSIAIDVDTVSGTAAGFIIHPSRTFQLDARARTLRTAGHPNPLDEDVVLELHDDDIYVDSRIVSKWIPVTFGIDSYASRITVTPREPLPIQLRRDRERRLRSAMGAQDIADDDSPLIRAPYQPLDGPFIDQTLRFVSTRARRSETQFTTYATGDLLYSQADLFLSGTASDPFSETRFTLSRKDPFAGLLGPLRAREVAVGDVFLPGDDLLVSGAAGDGFVVSSYPLVRQTQFGRHTFRGNLPPGWDVELYQNGSLIQYQQSRADGLYEFGDVPLLFGTNTFRLLFYGPTGESREEIYLFNIGESLAPAGKTYYRFAGNSDRLSNRRLYADVEHGLRRNLSFSAAVVSEDVTGIRDEFARVGLSGFWTSIFAHGDIARSASGGSAVRAFVQSRIGPVDVFVQHAVFDDFQSEVFRPMFGPIRNDSRLRLDGLLRASNFAIPLTTDLHHQRIAGGGDFFELQQRIAAQVGRTFLSNQIIGATIRNHPTLSSSTLRGSLIGSRMLRSFAMRGEANYSLTPTGRLENFTVLGESFRVPGFVFQAGLRRGFDTDDTAVLFGVNRNEGSFAAGVSGSYSRNEGATLTVNLFAGLARDSRSGQWTTSARPVAGSGAASTLVFIDSNGNGRWDEGEQPISGAGFFVDRVSQRPVTDAGGTALLTGIPPFEVHRVAISPATLEDPLLVPTEPSVRVVPRPGKPQVIDFPVLITGEVNGTAFFRAADGSTREAAGVQLELIAGDAVIAETRSAYDGFFQFTTVRPGSYAIRVKPQQSARLGTDSSFARELTIDATGSILDGVDLILDRRVPGLAPPAASSFSVAGRLTTCNGSRPIPRATLFLFGPSGSAEAQSADDGSFEFRNVAPGHYLVVFARETLEGIPPSDLPRLKIEVRADVKDVVITTGCRG